MLIIGIAGKKRSGKDTVGRHLHQKYGYQRFAFADEVRAALLRLDPIVFADWYEKKAIRLSEYVDRHGWEKAKEIQEVRGLLKRMGTEAIRSIDRFFWVRKTMLDVDLCTAERVVITDVRFQNEANAILDRSGYIIRIVRPETEDDDAHQSETELDQIWTDYTVVNDGSLQQLQEKVDEILEEIELTEKEAEERVRKEAQKVLENKSADNG